MPRAALNDSQISEIREKILDIAADIINEDGFSALSMRKIGARVGMTAANLYNYYANKDEINIAIRLRAGRMLYRDLLSAYDRADTLSGKIRRMIRAYVRFGLEWPNYYAIMFDMPTPRFSDYVGSPLEETARREKAESERSAKLLLSCIEEMRSSGVTIPTTPDIFMTLVWSQLHGLVSLYNNHTLSEVVALPEETVNEASEHVYSLFFSALG